MFWLFDQAELTLTEKHVVACIAGVVISYPRTSFRIIIREISCNTWPNFVV